ncbi:MAG: nucleotidyltransferase domain-containing protein, partial [Longimicrobiaceae bacterium]
MRCRDVIEALDAAGVRYVVVGGVAMVLRGCERETADLDLVVDAAPEPAERALRALGRAGFTPT